MKIEPQNCHHFEVGGKLKNSQIHIHVYISPPFAPRMLIQIFTTIGKACGQNRESSIQKNTSLHVINNVS